MSTGAVGRHALGGLLLCLLLAGCSHEAANARPPFFFGVDVPRGDPDAVDRLARMLHCRPSVTSAFVKLDSDFGRAELTTLTRGGRTPMVTLEPWSWRMTPGTTSAPGYSLRLIAAGGHDRQLRTIARTLATYDGTVLLRFAHEMNANWYPWGTGVNGNLPRHYVAAWRHVHRVMSEVADNLEWVWAPVAAWWHAAPPLRAFYPGDGQVDLVGVTGYGHGGTARETFGDWYREVRQLTDKPAVLTEIGADGPRKTRWIASLSSFMLARPRIVGFVWFNTSPETIGATGDYRIDQNGHDLHAFRALLTRLHPVCDPPTTQEAS